MRIAKLTLLSCCPLVLCAALALRAYACGGTFKPNCFQTIWLAKYAPETVLYPGEASDIDIPIGLLPFVAWNTTATGPFACAQPVSAALTLTLTCTPTGGGAAIPIGPLSVPVATPAVPGAQVAPSDGSPFYTFTIPAGTLPASGVPYVCTVVGTYTVTFGAGVGSGTLTAVGDTEVCIVDPAPDDPALPRLAMQRLRLGDVGHRTCRRGDQVNLYYLIENNDPSNSVSLNFTSITNQVARMPTSDNATDETLYAISDPGENTDNYPQAFADELPDGGMIPLPDPLEDSDRMIMRQLVLGPNEVTIIGVATRSFGMCANGSCSEALAKVTGTFEDGSPALACASTALLVDDAGPKSPLCEITDTIKAAATVDARWSMAVFDETPFLTTHFAGNLSGDDGGPATVTAGEGLNVPWASQATDSLRADSAVSRVTYGVDAFPQDLNFAQIHANVSITGLGAGVAVVVPMIYTGAGSSLSIALDATAGGVVVTDDNANGQELFNGLYSALLENPPQGLQIDLDTCRTIVVDCSNQSAAVLRTDPPFFAQLFASGSAPENLLVSVLDQLTSAAVSWTAASDVDGVVPVDGSGVAGEELQLAFDLEAIASAPKTEIAMISVINGAALNSPLVMPVVVRQAAQGDGGGNENDNATGNQNDNGSGNENGNANTNTNANANANTNANGNANGNANANANANGNANTNTNANANGNANANANGNANGNDNTGNGDGGCGTGSCGVSGGTTLSLLLMLMAMRWQTGARRRRTPRRPE